MFQRTLRLVNWLIAVLIVIVLVAAYWFVWRPLPETSGTLSVPIAKPVRVARDRLGVPHIAAETLDDALFAQGFVTAQDRLWQMDAIRRLAAGELSEVLGPATLELDNDSRRLRLRRIAEESARGLAAQDRAPLAAYARGVNHFIETHRNRLPLEFSLLRYDPRPWSITDSLLIGLHMYRTLTTTWRDELLKEAMLKDGDRDKVNYLFAVRSGNEIQPGSNAWAISGRHTASGKPILASDPHLEYSFPSVWYMVHLQAPGLNASGVSLPGVPGVIIGHNDRIAWGVTNLHFDVQDLYAEKFDFQSGRYLYRGQVEQARREQEFIAVKGSRPVEQVNWITRHGPIFINADGRFLALRWAAADLAGFGFPFLDIDRARTWQEFTSALARFPGPAQNFVYADIDGNIGYHAAGKLPIRKTYDGDVPADGSSGEFEWDGYIPFDQLPAFYNPPAGMIVTANQNPFPPNYPYRVNGNFASHYRSSQIRALLSSRQAQAAVDSGDNAPHGAGWKPAEMLAVQKDVYSASARFLAEQAGAAWDAGGSKDARVGDAIDLLRNWNGQVEPNLAAPLVAQLLYQHLRKQIAERASPSKGAAYELQMAPAAVEKLLRDRPAGWFDDYNQLLLGALLDALDEGRRMQGRDVKKWRWGVFNRVTIPHPVGSRLPLVSDYFKIGPIPMAGSSTTVKQTTLRLAPSMRMVADLSAWDSSLCNVTIGQSGQPLSPHFKDQWGSYYAGTSFPMQFEKVEAKAILMLTPSGADGR